MDFDIWYRYLEFEYSGTVQIQTTAGIKQYP